MKNILAIFPLFLISAISFAGPNNSLGGDWADPTTWAQAEVPDDASTLYDHVNIAANTTVTVSTIETYNKNMWTKGGSSLILAEGGTLNYGGQIAMDGGKLVFMGGSLVMSANINQSSSSEGYVFGSTDEDGNFYAAAAKSVNSTKRLQFISGTKAVYNLGASNLIASKSTGLDDNAIFYTSGELQALAGDIYLDFSNITAEALAENGISESGTYYVALMSFGVTYKTIGGTDFTPVLAEDSAVSTDFVSFEGFEWANDSKNNNTLYAVLNINPTVPEPSTYAAIFGALALAFVAYKRRK